MSSSPALQQAAIPAQLILLTALYHGHVHLGAELAGQAALRGLDDDGGVGGP